MTSIESQFSPQVFFFFQKKNRRTRSCSGSPSSRTRSSPRRASSSSSTRSTSSKRSSPPASPLGTTSSRMGTGQTTTTARLPVSAQQFFSTEKKVVGRRSVCVTLTSSPSSCLRFKAQVPADTQGELADAAIVLLPFYYRHRKSIRFFPSFAKRRCLKSRFTDDNERCYVMLSKNKTHRTRRRRR
jgi:hypothetical protein